MSDSEATAEKAYAPPASQLLQLGEPRGNERQAWRDYAAMGISTAAVPELIRMATDDVLHDSPRDSQLVWAPVHAWRALGQLRVPEAIAPLLMLFQRADDADEWVMSDLPKALAQIGAAAIEPVANYLADTTRGEWERVTAADALGHIGQAHPELRAECVTRVAAQLENFAEQSDTLNAFLVAPLWNLRAVEAMSVLERAFASGHVDESVNGDLEDLQIHFGLKVAREHPPKPNSLTEMNREIAGLHEEIQAYERENAELRSTLDELTFEPPPMPYLAPPKIGRNDPCPCGSGKKYKKCCGA
ncbi:MAG TPA: SEC-C metal-binding domain-containing protein [Verrucomicrobiae bacterium]|nr:SEC-C metal-binding domain-containing protein [Verrucomicrobiae bacterium]